MATDCIAQVTFGFQGTAAHRRAVRPGSCEFGCGAILLKALDDRLG